MVVGVHPEVFRNYFYICVQEKLLAGLREEYGVPKTSTRVACIQNNH